MHKKVAKYTWADQYKTLPNQSDFHEIVRYLFCQEAPFKGLRCYQEVAVQDLIPEYDNSLHRYDWYIEELKLIVELHGEQHYRPANFGNVGYDTLMRSFEKTKLYDSLKKNAAVEAGFRYVAIPYSLKSKLDGDLLRQLLLSKEIQ